MIGTEQKFLPFSMKALFWPLLTLFLVNSIPNHFSLAWANPQPNLSSKHQKLIFQQKRKNLLLAKKNLKKAIHIVQKEKSTPPKKAKKDPNRYELGLLPAINYSSDTGFGFGVIGSLAKFSPSFYPYRWKLAFLIYATARDSGNGIEFPYHDDYIKLDFPGLAGGNLRINARINFARYTTAGYYGLGNASKVKKPWEQFDPKTQPEEYNIAKRYQQYDRIYPYILLNARFKLFDNHNNVVELFAGGRITQNWIKPYPKSQLEEDIAGKSGPYTQTHLIGTSDHGELMGNFGLIWDTRDNETAPTEGIFNEISFRAGTGLGLPFMYGGINMTLRFFIPIHRQYLVIAGRIIGDMLFGDVPLYELSRFGGLFPNDGPGGGSSLRGVANLRYHGKAKIIGNLELRSKLLPFNIGSQKFNLGIILFTDAGRVWSEYFYPNSDLRYRLDGDDFDIKYSVGGGLRLQWGETFIVRLDLAQSLSDDRFGFYLNVNHIF